MSQTPQRPSGGGDNTASPSPSKGTAAATTPTPLDAEHIAAHFPHTRKLLEERCPSGPGSPEHPRGGASNGRDDHHRDDQHAHHHHNHDGDTDAEEAVDDDEAVNTLMDGYDPETAQRFTKLHKRRAELSRTVQERFERAQARREQLQEERRQHLMQVERQRQAKTQQTRALRRAATERFVLEAPVALNILRGAGLVCDEGTGHRPLSADGVELILCSDPRTCDVCTAPEALTRPVCPATGQPHRRLLVVAAEKFLKLIGDTRVNLIPSKIDAVGSAAIGGAAGAAGGARKKPATAAAAPAVGGATNGGAQPTAPPTTTTNKAKRGIAVNPQLFVLAYYNAVLPDGEVDPLLRDCAISMAQTVEQIRQLLVQIHKHIPKEKVPTRLTSQSSNATVATVAGVDTTTTAASAPSTPSTTGPIITEAEERLLKPLLIAFSREWQRYARLSNQHILATISEEGRKEAQQELVQSTIEALRHAYQRLAAVVAEAGGGGASNSNNAATAALATAENAAADSPAAAAVGGFVSIDDANTTSGSQTLSKQQQAAEVQILSSMIAMLRARLTRVGGNDALVRFDEEMQTAEANGGGGYYSATNSDANPMVRNVTDVAKRAAARKAAFESNTAGGDGNASDAFGPSSAISSPDAANTGNNHEQQATSSSASAKTRGQNTIPPIFATANADRNHHHDPHHHNASEIVFASPLLGPPAPPNTPQQDSSKIAFSRVPSTAFDDDMLSGANNSNTAGGGGAAIRTPSGIPRPSGGLQTQRQQQQNLEYLGTSGSDTDLGGAFPRRGAGKPLKTFGPELPPLWSVGSDGKSHPPSPAVLEQEHRSRLEYRARAAYTAKLKRDAMAATQAEAEEKRQRDELTQAFDELMWDQFRRELDDTHPPVLGRIPHLLNAVAESLIEALPRRIRSKVGQEIRDVLDWDVLRNRLKGRSSGAAGASSPATASPTSAQPQQQQQQQQRFDSVTSLVIYVINRVAQLGAPAREEELHAKAQGLVRRLHVLVGGSDATAGSATSAAANPTTSNNTNQNDTIGTLIVEMFKFMFASIKQLRQDIASYSLQMVSHELVGKASEYEKEFVKECMPAEVDEWASTKEFLAKGLKDAETVPVVPVVVAAPAASTAAAAAPNPLPTLRPIAQSLPSSILFITADDKKLFAGVLSGVVDLLRSSGRDTATRWLLFPKESLYFARPLIFEAANTVQLCTLRLMLSGTVSMIMAPHRINGAQVQQFLGKLDAKVTKWLGGGNNNATNGGANNDGKGTTPLPDDDEPVINTIEDVKNAITEEVSVFMGSNPLIGVGPTAKSAEKGLILSEADVAVLHGVIAKMTDTSSPQYTLFETRVLRAVACVALSRITLEGSGLSTGDRRDGDVSSPVTYPVGGGNSAATATTATVGVGAVAAANATAEAALRGCGMLVTPQIREMGALVGNVVLQNWDVYRGYYAAMLPLLTTAAEAGATDAQQ